MDDFEIPLATVRADSRAFRRDVEEMRRTLTDGLGGAADIAGRRIESALLRAVRTGKFGFEDLKRTALAILSEIAGASIRTGLDSAFGGKGGGGLQGGLLAIGTQLASAFLGVPGRAAGGPVSPGRAYRVGERGPELFVPTASGRIETPSAAPGRDVRVSITLNAPEGREPEALARSGRQIARDVRRALERSF
ncbi:tail tape measure protein [Parasphingopyxis marina]|uniref:Tail tape measure protein n=1 Tax=Parasphingopyxis marina TaxID=2761622 RepID=A0A842I0X7_9SPHN|nr:tail tape measure protein [Parasphingopyxis marina]MBC2778309.1 tail tape measure protein [Parasphingopyxis marina]